MALSGLHVNCGYAGPFQRRDAAVGILGRVAWSETMAAPGTTTNAAPANSDGAGEPMFQVYAATDAFIAIGKSPNASTGPRVFVPAATRVEVYAEQGDKMAWIAA
jgi:hypothetical protein